MTRLPTFERPRDVVLHHDLHPGRTGTRPVVFANSLGTDLRIWGDVRSRLDPGIPVLAMDKRGHGLSGEGPCSIDELARDVADLMEHYGLSGAIVCGVSVGGMIAQALAAARPDLVVGLMLCNTAPRIGTAEAWNARIDAVRSGGIAGMADDVLARWFSPAWREANPAALDGWRQMLVRTPAEGYAGTCAAIRDADLTGSTAALDVPTVCIAGGADASTPPELVRAMADSIPGAAFHLLEDVGHLPCIEAPDAVADLLIDFHGAVR